MKSLGIELPKETARVREILGHYKEIGLSGVFGAVMIEQSLKAADKAMIAGDVAMMIAAYNDLKEITG